MRCFENLEEGLKRHSLKLSQIDIILDFGCGCGRTLRYFADWSQSPKRLLYGVDVYSDVVDWCRKNIKFATVESIDVKPPLKFDAGYFDLVYAISVFSHLEEQLHLSWLREIKRVLRPGGLALISIHGNYCYEPYVKGFERTNLPDNEPIPPLDLDENELNNKRFAFFPIDETTGYGNSFISPFYIWERWGNIMDVVEIIPLGMDRLQDLVVLRKSESRDLGQGNTVDQREKLT